MLIIEGSDCLGKTTFANLLVRLASTRFISSTVKAQFPIYYNHMSRPNSGFDFFNHYTDMMTKFAVQDRFHIGGIVWHDAISQAQLDIIEGRLRALGSMTVVMYASDVAWYCRRVQEDERGNMLSLEAMTSANALYAAMAQRQGSSYQNCTKPIIDYGFDVKKSIGRGDNLSIKREPQFPDVEYANHILNKWFERLSLLEV